MEYQQSCLAMQSRAALTGLSDCVLAAMHGHAVPCSDKGINACLPAGQLGHAVPLSDHKIKQLRSNGHVWPCNSMQPQGMIACVAAAMLGHAVRCST